MLLFTNLIHLALVSVNAALFILALTLLLESLAALLPRSARGSASQTSARTAILIPAHDEAIGISNTLTFLQADLRSHQEIVVVADNCSDTTAEVARSLGATVYERQDLSQRGKGYALDFGIRNLAARSPEALPEVVVCIDADCQMSAASVEALAQQVIRTGTAAQSINLVTPPAHPSPKDRLSAFAFKVKNLVRSLGMEKLGIPCLLMGTGMAFPWPMIERAELANGHLAEDKKLGVDLIIAGHPTWLCPEAIVLSALPQQGSAATQQKSRWELGHLQTLSTYAPTLFKAAIAQRRWDLLGVALDLCIPPLALLVMLCVTSFLIASVAGFLGIGWLPAGLGLTATGAIAIAVLVAWVRFGRSDLSLQQLLSIPLYLLWKIPMYLKFFKRAEVTWTRTDRDTV
jgi:cellulose synthase/poly-beta-1,6-N-acetylglucosamine synthase-like glycosyltransferase